VFSSVFQCFWSVLRVLLKYSKTLAKQHPQNITKHPQQNTTEHHKTHLLTKQPEFSKKPALAPIAVASVGTDTI